MKFITSLASAAIVVSLAAGPAFAKCSNSSAGFEQFKKNFAKKARSAGVGDRGLKALAGAKYSNSVIKFDRKQARYFKSAGRSKTNFNKFYAKKTRGLASRVRSRLKQNRKLFDSIERNYGVQREVLATIWGMETNFGGYTGKIDAINALATLSHDCRRTGLFQPNLLAALKIVDNGWISRGNMKGAGHGELGQTQFMAKNYLNYAVDYNGDGRRDLVKSSADALASTANFLRRHGWQPMGSYQPGSNNFRVLNSWNESTAYQQTIAKFAASL